MTAQIVEIAGQKMAVLPVAEYEHLLELVEDRIDAAAAVNAEQRRTCGEEYVPSNVVDRLLAGENPLRVWRGYRGLSQTRLSAVSGVSNNDISRYERGERQPRLPKLRLLAEALNVTIDDLT